MFRVIFLIIFSVAVFGATDSKENRDGRQEGRQENRDGKQDGREENRDDRKTNRQGEANWEITMRMIVNTKDQSGTFLLKERVLANNLTKKDCLGNLPELSRKIEQGKVDVSDNYILTSAEKKNDYLVEGNIYFIQQGVSDRYKMFCRKMK